MGILESKNEPFMKEVIGRLSGVDVEFMSLGMERAPIERGYGVVVDRLSFCYPFLREIAKSLALSGTYVINNPFAALATNKILDIRLGSRLGVPFPKTIILPDRRVTQETDGLVTQPDLHGVADEVGLPCILKPFDGYAWDDVYMVRSVEELQNLYLSLSSRHVLLAQQLVNFKSYFRVFCFDQRDVLFVRWVPKPMAMGEYLYCDPASLEGAKDRLTALTIQLNQVLDLDVNVVEWCVDGKGQWWVIDAFNEVPEVIPGALPPEYYSWLVDKFAACITDKLNSGRKNRTPFVVP